MRIAARISRRDRREESAVPMINVVLLLLIFVLMTAQLTAAPPFPVAAPTGSAPALEGQETPPLYVDGTGALAFGALRGDEARAAAAGAGDVVIVADRALPARDLARLMAALSAAGAGKITLRVEPAS